MQPIIAPVAPALMADELAPLTPLFRAGPCVVLSAPAEAIPATLREIGRLRELTFRAAGEGSGRDCDLDAFDAWYEHLFVWNEATRQVVGAYRVGRLDKILAERGVAGLYTSTLFHYSEAMLPRLDRALELGRSFVRAEAQRSTAGLPLLWKGLAAYIVRHPRYRRMLGPVSIDRRYGPRALQLMVGHLGRVHGHGEAARLVVPRLPYAPTDPEGRLALEAGAALPDLGDLAALVEALEGRGVPVLVRQYLKLGAEVLAFNVDPAFSDVVDALMWLDLDRVDAQRLARFMGASAVEGWRAAAP